MDSYRDYEEVEYDKWQKLNRHMFMKGKMSVEIKCLRCGHIRVITFDRQSDFIEPPEYWSECPNCRKN